MRWRARPWPMMLLFACVDRPLGDTTAGGTGSTGAPSTTTPVPGTSDPVITGPPATTEPVTSGPPTTGPATTTGAVTTGATSGGSDPSSTSTSGGGDPSSTSTSDADPPGTSTSGVKFDLPPFLPPPPGLVDCTFTAPAGTGIQGQTMLGAFAADRAYFGITTINGDPLLWPNLMLVSPGADATSELTKKNGATGPICFGEVQTDIYDHWFGTWPYGWVHVVADDDAVVPDAEVTIEAFAGNWDAADPSDPPRLLGSLTGELSGPFDAVYCNLLDVMIIAE